jgi:hypothetical protein
VLIIRAATGAVAAKTAEWVKTPTSAMVIKTGPVVFTAAVQVAPVTVLHLVTEYNLAAVAALESFGEQEEAFHQQAQETCDVIINEYCFV